MAEHFDSEPGKGVVASISKTNQLVNKGYIPFGEEGQSVSYQQDSKTSDVIFTGSSAYPIANGTILKRIPERAIRVWLAPFQDTFGHFHEGSYVYTVLSKAKWSIEAPVGPDRRNLHVKGGLLCTS
ncbi:MAG: TraV family lipoprotein [Flavobacteriales bacterium]|nr:TraV family lipoprotein [Flavobacteriales bacterium]